MDQATLPSAACVLLGTLRAGLRRERAEGGGVVDSGKARERRGRRMAVGVTCVAGDRTGIYIVHHILEVSFNPRNATDLL